MSSAYFSSRLLDAEQTAKKLNRTTYTLARWRRLRKGPRYVRFSATGGVLYREEDIDAFIAKHLVDSAG
jgi:hypothetical protein